MTESALMVPELRQILQENDTPINEASSVARAAAFLCVEGWNGKTLMVIGNQFVEVESGLEETRQLWLGETFAGHLNKAESVSYFTSKSGW